MASISAWTDANLVGQPPKRAASYKVVGTHTREFVSPYAKLGAADGNGSILGFALIPSDAVLTELKLLSDALAGFTSVSVGLYRLDRDGQTFLDTAKSDGTSAKAILLALTDMNAGSAVGSERDCMAAVVIADRAKKVWELLGFTDPKLVDQSYVIALTCATAGTAAGNIVVRGRYILA